MRTPIHILACAAILLTGSAAAAQTTQTYRYDANGRLTATITAGPNSGVLSSYLLDDADNQVARNNFPGGSRAIASRLSSGEFLLPGQQLTSADGRLTLKAQQDGDLVLWFGSTPLWASATANGKSLYLRLESSGVTTLVDARGVTLWATPAAGANATLTLQNDGNLVLKSSGGSVVWQSNTCCH